MCNQDIRLKVASSGLKLWQIADKMGITDSSFSRKLRKELPPLDKQKIFEIIADLKAGEHSA